MSDIWEDDRLGYAKIGESFSRLVRTIKDGRVISIEAGFGRGKTFFRKKWAEQLREEGQVVIELDVLRSDHSGDAMVTLLGAMTDAVPKEETARREKAFKSAKKLGALAARTGARVLLRAGAEEVIEHLSETAQDKVGDDLKGVVESVGEGLSNEAGKIIAAQLVAEKARADLPKTLQDLRAALVGEDTDKPVIVIVDELDRCHPDYAIAFLEAMKVTFQEAGFVFCLMVNADYLETLAKHRFGSSDTGEKYLDKFVDLRLKLAPSPDAKKAAVAQLVEQLPLAIPFGEDEAFSTKSAGEMAGRIAQDHDVSFRRVERVLLKVETALRLYADRPLDVSLLLVMAFEDAIGPSLETKRYLKRSELTPEMGEKIREDFETTPRSMSEGEAFFPRLQHQEKERFGPLYHLPLERYGEGVQENTFPVAKVFLYLAPQYLPSHRDVLDAVAEILVDG